MNFKKIMAIGAATLCSTVLADVTSANIVGYAPTELQEAGLTAGSAFIPVSHGDCDLVDIIVTGYKDASGVGECKGDVKIQTQNEYGKTLKTYEWRDYVVTRSGKIMAEYYGWYDIDNNQLVVRDQVTFQAGEGLWTNCKANGFNLQSNGEVPQSTVVVELQEAGLSIANPMPVTCDLTKCIVTGYKDAQGVGECKGDVKIQTQNEYGKTLKTYEWRDYVVTRSGKIMAEYLGWYDIDNNQELTEGIVTMKPGEGLWTNCKADGFNFVFPGVEIK